MKILTLGLSISSSWGNGHATTFRSLYSGLKKRGHTLYFLERDKPWYANNRDFSSSEDFELLFYDDIEELREKHNKLIREADVVIVGSYVPDGVEVINYVLKNALGIKMFYDIDTPVTLEKLRHQDFEYLHPSQIKHFDFYLSFSGGRTLKILSEEFEAQRPKAFYCSFDEALYSPQNKAEKWLLGYLGTYSNDRQPGLEELLIKPAKENDGDFVVAGPSYPETIDWPANVERIDHLPPSRHRDFYCSQRFTLNITRQAMKALGHSPSVRLFEAAACGIPIISDFWEGLDELFIPGEEIIIAHDRNDVIKAFKMNPEYAREIGQKGRNKVIEKHSGYARAGQLETYLNELIKATVG